MKVVLIYININRSDRVWSDLIKKKLQLLFKSMFCSLFVHFFFLAPARDAIKPFQVKRVKQYARTAEKN